MKANIEIGQEVKVRIVSFTSFRHYGGREITSKSNIVNAKLIKMQSGFQPYIVELLDKCESLPKGHKIAVSETDFNI